MGRRTFSCIDGHTCGNPIRMVVSGGPALVGANMSEKRAHFQKDYDWIRRALMFEPRGHDMMSGTILYPAISDDADLAVLFIETSGCLPMCGHGTIGTVTAALEYGYARPQTEGRIVLDVPAGRVELDYQMTNGKVDWVQIHNVSSYVAAENIEIECPELGVITLDVAYGGNFYAIIDPQKNFPGLGAGFSAKEVLRLSPIVRDLVNERVWLKHPDDATICGTSHVMWTGAPTKPNSNGRNAVFYGDNAIDRSPCGTGTSARMAQLSARGILSVGEEFIHESIIGSQFVGKVEAPSTVGSHAGIRPSVRGWAKVTGVNTIFVDDDDPYAYGFQVV